MSRALKMFVAAAVMFSVGFSCFMLLRLAGHWMGIPDTPTFRLLSLLASAGVSIAIDFWYGVPARDEVKP